MGPWSDALDRRENRWRARLKIPKKANKGTPAILRHRLRALWDKLGRPEPAGLMDWNVNRLFAVWFEASAERIMQREYPDDWQRLKDRPGPRRRDAAGQGRLDLLRG